MLWEVAQCASSFSLLSIVAKKNSIEILNVALIQNRISVFFGILKKNQFNLCLFSLVLLCAKIMVAPEYDVHVAFSSS
jgi:hypothetical protein